MQEHLDKDKTKQDERLIQLVHTHTDLTEDDIAILLELSHSLSVIGSLENGDTYINVLTRDGKSLVIAQYRHPYCDLYKRDIVGEFERKEDEPAVYQALEYGTPSRGLIGMIEEGRIIVRHTVSAIFNRNHHVIGALTYEHPNANADTEPIRFKTPDGVLMDVSAQERDQYLSKIRELEDELIYRAALIQEVNHRVKNHLQMMISLLGLKAAQSDSEEVKEFAAAASRRIRSMSMVYDILAHSGSEQVEIKQLLEHLLTATLEGMTEYSEIRQKVSGKPLELEAADASTVALVVNELIQNSLKYALHGNKGSICITLKQHQGMIQISVQDSGDGYNKTPVTNSGGLGLKLVESMVQSKLNGTFAIESNEQGTCAMILFPVREIERHTKNSEKSLLNYVKHF